MPKPFIFNCSKCTFSDSSYSTWGEHFYVVKGDTIPVNRKLGLCHHCNSVVSVEVLGNQTFFYSQESKRLDEKRVALLKTRKSKPRCLKCGSHNFEVIPTIESDKDRSRSGTPVRTGLFHKNCGGRIYTDFKTPNFFMGDKLPKRYFSLEGIEISEPNL